MDLLEQRQNQPTVLWVLCQKLLQIKINQVETVAEHNHSELFGALNGSLNFMHFAMFKESLDHIHIPVHTLQYMCLFSLCGSHTYHQTIIFFSFYHPSLYSFITIVAQKCHLVVETASSALICSDQPTRHYKQSSKILNKSLIFCLFISLPANTFVYRTHVS